MATQRMPVCMSLWPEPGLATVPNAAGTASNTLPNPEISIDFSFLSRKFRSSFRAEFCSLDQAPASPWSPRPRPRRQRLKKDCLPSTSIRNSKIKKKPISRTAGLEEKVDGLFSLLRSQANVADKQPGVSSASSVLTAPQAGIPTPQFNFDVSPFSIREDITEAS
jgi:hypothetical protein